MKNQEGFTIVEVLLVILVIAVIGFGGYTVWNNNQDQDNSDAVVTQQDSDVEAETENDTVAEEETEVEAVELKDYSNSKYGFSFSHPSDATIEEREDAQYFQVVAEKNDGDNPALNVFGEGNYKIQVQAYDTELSLENFIAQGVDGKLQGAVTESNGTSTAVSSVSSEEIQGPGYDIYWFGKDGLVVNVILYGDAPVTINEIVNTVSLN